MTGAFRLFRWYIGRTKPRCNEIKRVSVFPRPANDTEHTRAHEEDN